MRNSSDKGPSVGLTQRRLGQGHRYHLPLVMELQSSINVKGRTKSRKEQSFRGFRVRATPPCKTAQRTWPPGHVSPAHHGVGDAVESRLTGLPARDPLNPNATSRPPGRPSLASGSGRRLPCMNGLSVPHTIVEQIPTSPARGKTPFYRDTTDAGAGWPNSG